MYLHDQQPLKHFYDHEHEIVDHYEISMFGDMFPI